MSHFSITARPPRQAPRPVKIVSEADTLATVLEDAAHFPGGHATGLAVPTTEGDVANVLTSGHAILPVGAQSSLTGGATPMGEVVLSTSRLNQILDIGRDYARVQAGVTLVELEAALDRESRYYPPAPTHAGACIGGTVATNAAGAGTFKYGTTRDWVSALTVVLATGHVLDVERGAVRAHADGYFEVVLPERTVRVPVPHYRMPEVPKVSAGYFARPDMDLIDLFIGSEGTLGVITEVTLRIAPSPPALCLAFVPFADRAAALAFVRRLREAARSTWRTQDPGGIDVAAIEQVDRRCLALLHEDGVDAKTGVAFPDDTAIALLVTLELPPESTSAQAFDEIGRARDGDAPDTPLVRFCRAIDEAGVFDAVAISVPGDRARAEQLLAVREAVPTAVNERVGRAKQHIDARIEKTAGDMIVPFDRMEGPARPVRRRVQSTRARRGRMGTHLRRQRAPKRHSKVVSGRRVRQGGAADDWPRGHSARRLTARRARCRAQRHQAAVIAGAVRIGRD